MPTESAVAQSHLLIERSPDSMIEMVDALSHRRRRVSRSATRMLLRKETTVWRYESCAHGNVRALSCHELSEKFLTIRNNVQERGCCRRDKQTRAHRADGHLPLRNPRAVSRLFFRWHDRCIHLRSRRRRAYVATSMFTRGSRRTPFDKADATACSSWRVVRPAARTRPASGTETKPALSTSYSPVISCSP
jgi:hypothetical protein